MTHERPPLIDGGPTRTAEAMVLSAVFVYLTIACLFLLVAIWVVFAKSMPFTNSRERAAVVAPRQHGPLASTNDAPRMGPNDRAGAVAACEVFGPVSRPFMFPDLPLVESAPEAQADGTPSFLPVSQP